METLKVRLSVDAPADAVWRALADFAELHRFSPDLRATRLITPIARRIGAKRRSEFYSGGFLVEEVTEWREGESLTTEWVESPFPLDWAQQTVSVRGEADQSAVIAVELAYQPKNGFFGRCLDRLVWRHRYARRLRAMVRGLEFYVLTGEAVGEHGSLAGTGRELSVASEL